MSLKKKLIHFSSKFEKNSIDYSFPIDYCLPVYHTISDENLPHLKHIIQYKNTQQFEKDLDYLLLHFQFVDWSDFKDYQQGKPKKQKIALLTFDDGLREFHDVVAPILERKGVFAMNFINPKYIDNQDLMFRCKASLIIDNILHSTKNHTAVSDFFQLKNASLKILIKRIQLINYLDQKKLDEIAEKIDLDFDYFLKTQKPYLTSEELQKLSAKGFGISAHGWDHPLYFELSDEEQLQNTFKSLDFMEENGFISDSFAFPFSDFGVKQQFFSELFKQRKMFCSFGSAGIKLDSFEKNYHRIPMETNESAEEILKNQVSYFKLKKLLYKNKIRRI